MTFSRRRFLGLGTLATVGASALVGGPREAEAADKPLPQVPRRVLGKTGQKIPILLFGGSMKLDGRFDPKIAEAMRFGVNYVDAADCYGGGTCEAAVGSFHTLGKNRDQLWITSKSDRHEPEGFEARLVESLKQLKTDHVDMYFLHGLEDAQYLSAELFKRVERLKREGKLKYFGFSCHSSTVVELLNKAAASPAVDAVMFRYNFRQYGNKELNAAMDACARAKVGLIAMKTQASESSVADAAAKFTGTGKWNKYQAVLKAVWADERITAAVSQMDNFEKLRQNIAAALDKSEMGALELEAVEKYAAATRASACDGCDHLCNPAVDAPVRIGDTMRALMYHDGYADPEKARDLWSRLPAEARALRGVDFTAAARACPHGVDIAHHMSRASALFEA